MRYDKVCVECGGHFDTDIGKKMYCSETCVINARSKRYIARHQDEYDKYQQKYRARPERVEYMKQYHKKWDMTHKEYKKQKAHLHYLKRKEKLREEKSMNEKLSLETLQGLDDKAKDAILEAIFRALSTKKAKTIRVAQEAPKELRPLTKTAKIVDVLHKMHVGEYLPTQELIKAAGSKSQHLNYIIATNPILELIEMGCIGDSICKLKPIPDEYISKKYSMKERQKRMRFEMPIQGKAKYIEMKMPTIRGRPRKEWIERANGNGRTKWGTGIAAFNEIVSRLEPGMTGSTHYFVSQMTKQGFKAQTVHTYLKDAVDNGQLEHLEKALYKKL